MSKIILLLFSIFEFNPYFYNTPFILIPFKLRYSHLGDNGIITDHYFLKFIYNKKSYDLGVSLIYLFDEGISEKINIAPRIVHGGSGIEFFAQKKFIGKNEIILPLSLNLYFLNFTSQLRTKQNFTPGVKFEPSFYFYLKNFLKSGLKLNLQFNGQGTEKLYEASPFLKFIYISQTLPDFSLSLGIKNIFSNEKKLIYPQLKFAIFFKPSKNIFTELELKGSIKEIKSEFSEQNIYGESIFRERLGINFLIGFNLGIEKKRKIEIFVKNEEGESIDPEIESKPSLGLDRIGKGHYVVYNPEIDTYKLNFSYENLKDTFLIILPEDVEESKKIEIIMKEIEKKVSMEEKESVKEVKEIEEITEEEIIKRNKFVIYFDSASAYIKEIYSDTLFLIKEILDKEKESKNVKIVGNASPEGNKEFNKKLSLERAERVYNFLKLILEKKEFHTFQILSNYDPSIEPRDIPRNKWKFLRKAEIFILKKN